MIHGIQAPGAGVRGGGIRSCGGCTVHLTQQVAGITKTGLGKSGHSGFPRSERIRRDLGQVLRTIGLKEARTKLQIMSALRPGQAHVDWNAGGRIYETVFVPDKTKTSLRSDIDIGSSRRWLSFEPCQRGPVRLARDCRNVLEHSV